MTLTQEQKEAISKLTDEEREVIAALGKIAKYTKHRNLCDGPNGMCMFWNPNDRICILRTYDCPEAWIKMLGFYAAILEDEDT